MRQNEAQRHSTTFIITRCYVPDSARQVQALLRLLAYQTGEAAADKHHEEGKRVDKALPEYEEENEDE